MQISQFVVNSSFYIFTIIIITIIIIIIIIIIIKGFPFLSIIIGYYKSFSPIVNNYSIQPVGCHTIVSIKQLSFYPSISTIYFNTRKSLEQSFTVDLSVISCQICLIVYSIYYPSTTVKFTLPLDRKDGF